MRWTDQRLDPTRMSETFGKAGLDQDCIGEMAGLDLAIDHEIPTADRAVPDFVISPSLSDSVGSGCSDRPFD